MYSGEQVAEGGSRAAAGLPGEWGSVQGPWPAQRTHPVGGSRGGVLQVSLKSIGWRECTLWEIGSLRVRTRCSKYSEIQGLEYLENQTFSQVGT